VFSLLKDHWLIITVCHNNNNNNPFVSPHCCSFNKQETGIRKVDSLNGTLARRNGEKLQCGLRCHASRHENMRHIFVVQKSFVRRRCDANFVFLRLLSLLADSVQIISFLSFDLIHRLRHSQSEGISIPNQLYPTN